MFHELEAEDVEEETEAMVPTPVGPPSLGPFRRLNLEFGCTYAAAHDRLNLKVTVQVVRVMHPLVPPNSLTLPGQRDSASMRLTPSATQPMRREERQKIIHGIRTVQQYRKIPFIHQLLWITQREDNLYLITEYPEDSLQSIVNRQGPLETAHATRLFTQVLIAVSALHSNHTAHRNLTLRTILLCGGVAKLSGFDWVNQFADSVTDTLLEQSLHYCAPELVNKEDVTKFDRTKTDMWALGCIYYALICGELPFDDDCQDSIAEAICTSGPFIPPNMDPDVAGCIQALLHPDPILRPSAAQLLRLDWIDAESVRVMDEFNMKIPDSLVEEDMIAYGFPHDHIAASRNDSEYNLSSAERYLVEARLRGTFDETLVPIVPSAPYTSRGDCGVRSPQPSRTHLAAAMVQDEEDDAIVPTIGSHNSSVTDATADSVFEHVDTHVIKTSPISPWDGSNTPYSSQFFDAH